MSSPIRRIEGRPAERAAIVLAGSRALAFLTARRDGVVIAGFRRSLYLRADDGALICLGASELGAGPLNALIDDWPSAAIGSGMTARWRGDALDIGGCASFAADTVAQWRPALLPPWSAATLARGLAMLAQAPARGLAAFALGRTAASSDPIDRALQAGFSAFADWLRRPRGDPPQACADLIGLGTGLTPAGDDAFGGALVALRQFGQRDAAARLSDWLLPRARAGTSEISLAHLVAAAAGEGAAALHDVLAALARGGQDLEAGRDRLDRIGHSSGWDALAGAVAALRRLARVSTNPDAR